MMVSFVLSFFPRDVLDEILNLIESVSEDFPSYSFVRGIQSTIKQKHQAKIFTFIKEIWTLKRDDPKTDIEQNYPLYGDHGIQILNL